MSFRLTRLARLESLLIRQRLISIDATGSELKLLLVESCIDQIRILQRVTTIAGMGGSTQDPATLPIPVSDALKDLGPHPLVVVFEGGREVSQIMELGETEESAVRQIIEKETNRLGDLGGGNIVFDYAAIPSIDSAAASYWVTLGNDADIEKALAPFASDNREIREVTSLPNAMVAAAQGCGIDDPVAMLLHLGHLKTSFVVIADKAPVFCSVIPYGLEFMKERMISEPPPATGFQSFGNPVESWKRNEAVNEWREEILHALKDNQDSIVPENFVSGKFKVYVCGDGGCEPGLIEYLNSLGRFVFQTWPRTDPDEDPCQASRFAIARGAALLSLGHVEHRASLLPSRFREAWKKASGLRRIQNLNLSLLCLALALFGIVLGQKVSLIRHKQDLIAQTSHVESLLMDHKKIKTQLAGQYERIRPVLELQKRTMDTLSALKSIQQRSENENYWFVLFADQESYFSFPAYASTNTVSDTNQTMKLNPSGTDYGFIAELCLTERGEALRKTLTELVDGLKKQSVFDNVDTLSTDRRRFIVSTNVLIPDQHFALSLKLKENEFLRPMPFLSETMEPAPQIPRKTNASGSKATSTNTFENRLNGGLKEVKP